MNVHYPHDAVGEMETGSVDSDKVRGSITLGYLYKETMLA